MNAPLRIALVASDWTIDEPTGRGGGIETYARVMSHGLAAAGHDVHVIGRARWHTHTSVAEGVTRHALAIPDTWADDAADLGEAREALSFAWQAWRHVRALAAEARFDVVEAPDYKAQGYYLARDAATRPVVKCHAHLKLCLDLNGVALAPDTALIADLERETLRRARAVHANSRALGDRCAADYGLDRARIAVVPYGIDTGRFVPTPSDLRATWGAGDDTVLLFVGRMEARKGIEALTAAFAALARRRDDVRLVLAGPDTAAPGRPSQWQWMTEQWAAAGVGPDRYRLLGTVPHESLPAVYSAADVMVAPSPYEPFGLVYLEAMACGAVPVGCEAGGAPEVIEDGVTGVLIAPNDAEALALALERLVVAPEARRRLSAAGRARVIDTFSVASMVSRTCAYYREVLA